MRPNEQITDLNFLQALRCVEYRLPKAHLLRREGYLHALALRYGLVGAAAAHHLLIGTKPEEEPIYIDALAHWPLAVEEHFRWQVLPKLPFEASPFLPASIGNLAYQPVIAYLDRRSRRGPLSETLHHAVHSYIVEYYDEIRAGWNWFQQARPVKEFRSLSEQSIRLAQLFFERRQLSLPEVPEIALLGE